MKLKLFVFQHKIISFDQMNDKGRTIKYAKVNVISKDEITAREKSKLDEDYILVEVKELGEDWYANTV